MKKIRRGGLGRLKTERERCFWYIGYGISFLFVWVLHNYLHLATPYYLMVMRSIPVL
jgi:hypothetical protein